MQETEVIAKTDTLRVRIMTLAPREVADWHYHRQVADDIFCLTGTNRSNLTDLFFYGSGLWWQYEPLVIKIIPRVLNRQ